MWIAVALLISSAAVQAPAGGLTTIRRVYVDRFGGGETAPQIRDMIIARLHATGLFVITENADRADAFLRGSAEDLVFTETHASSSDADGRSGVSLLGSALGRSRSAASSTARERESSRSTERRHEASAAVRLVDKNGDIIWSTMQESTGSKFRGASADVAEKVARQLVADYEGARRPTPP